MKRMCEVSGKGAEVHQVFPKQHKGRKSVLDRLGRTRGCTTCRRADSAELRPYRRRESGEIHIDVFDRQAACSHGGDETAITDFTDDNTEQAISVPATPHTRRVLPHRTPFVPSSPP